MCSHLCSCSLQRLWAGQEELRVYAWQVFLPVGQRQRKELPQALLPVQPLYFGRVLWPDRPLLRLPWRPALCHHQTQSGMNFICRTDIETHTVAEWDRSELIKIVVGVLIFFQYCAMLFWFVATLPTLEYFSMFNFRSTTTTTTTSIASVCCVVVICSVTLGSSASTTWLIEYLKAMWGPFIKNASRKKQFVRKTRI